jgi:hypothetical protein
MATLPYSKVVFAAMSKRSFYLREHIIKYCLQQKVTPTCAFMMFSYFLLDTVDRTGLIEANNELVRRSDELWVFGDISDGVKAEITLAESLNIPVKYFLVKHEDCSFTEIARKDAELETNEK